MLPWQQQNRNYHDGLVIVFAVAAAEQIKVRGWFGGENASEDVKLFPLPKSITCVLENWLVPIPQYVIDSACKPITRSGEDVIVWECDREESDDRKYIQQIGKVDFPGKCCNTIAGVVRLCALITCDVYLIFLPEDEDLITSWPQDAKK